MKTNFFTELFPRHRSWTLATALIWKFIMKHQLHRALNNSDICLCSKSSMEGRQTAANDNSAWTLFSHPNLNSLQTSWNQPGQMQEHSVLYPCGIETNKSRASKSSAEVIRSILMWTLPERKCLLHCKRINRSTRNFKGLSGLFLHFPTIRMRLGAQKS